MRIKGRIVNEILLNEFMLDILWLLEYMEMKLCQYSNQTAFIYNYIKNGVNFAFKFII